MSSSPKKKPVKAPAPKKASEKKSVAKKPAVKKAVTPKAAPAKGKPAKAKPAVKAPAKKPEKKSAVKVAVPAKKAAPAKPVAPTKKKPAVKTVAPVKNTNVSKPAAPEKKAEKKVAAPKTVVAPKQAAAQKKDKAEKKAPVAAVEKRPAAPAVPKPNYETVPTSRQTVAKTKTVRLQSGQVERFSPSELAEYKKKLLYMLDTLTSRVGAMKDSALKGMEDVNPEEDGTDASMRLVTLKQVGNQNQLRTEIEAALHAIDKGTFGVCEHCGKLIRKVRLQAQLFSKLCINCQNELEKRR